MQIQRLINLVVYCAGMVLLIALMAWLTPSCKTLETIKSESSAIQNEVVEAFDELGAEIVASIAEKVKAEIKRTRERLPDKVRRELERGAEKHFGLKLRLMKPPTKRQIAKAKIYVEHMKSSPRYQEIVDAGQMHPDKAYYKPPKWIPSPGLEAEFFKHNPKAKGVRRELQLVHLAAWKMNQQYLVYAGLRECSKQQEYFKKGYSKINDCTKARHVMGQATDSMPYKDGKILWKDTQTILYLRGMEKMLFCTLKKQYGWKGLKIRHGVDWDGNNKNVATGFVDYPHSEVREGTMICPGGVL